jgi:hypothetical protein
MQDLVVEFCRSGELGPLRADITAAEATALLGPPDSTNETQGEPSWQWFRWQGLAVLFRCGFDEAVTPQSLRLNRIRLQFRREDFVLPALLAERVVLDWPAMDLAQVLDVLRQEGVEVQANGESSNGGRLNQHFRVGRTQALHAVNGSPRTLQSSRG